MVQSNGTNMADRSHRQSEQPIPEFILRDIREKRWKIIRSGMGPEGYYLQPRSRGMMMGGGVYDDLPIMEPDDFGYIGPKPSYVVNFESACKDAGQLATVQAIVSSKFRTPAFLHGGLVLALSAGNVEIARYLLAAGAPIIRATPRFVLFAPVQRQIPLFELLAQNGWTPNIPGYYGEVLLRYTVTHTPLLRWFLDHGANPNLGVQRDYRRRFGWPEMESCDALHAAAYRGDIEAVSMLLEAGAKVGNGTPLHSAAGACPDGLDIHSGPHRLSREFDASKIPVMELLLEHGADVNQPEVSRHVVPRYAVVYAVMAGAVERVRWLLEHGANPELNGGWGSAIFLGQHSRSEEMRQVVEDGVAARRWINVSEMSLQIPLS